MNKLRLTGIDFENHLNFAYKGRCEREGRRPLKMSAGLCEKVKTGQSSNDLLLGVLGFVVVDQADG